MRTSPAEPSFLASRHYFWIFVAIFSVTIFCASTQIAARYCTYVEQTRTVSQPGVPGAAPSSVANGKAGRPDRSAEIERSPDQPVRSHS